MLLLAASVSAQEALPFFEASPETVVTSGKWIATSGSGDAPAFKHVVEIHCFRERSICMEATANVVGGNPDLHIQYYKVLRWDENGVVAESSEPICSTNQLIFNFREKSVLAIDAPKKEAKGLKGACKVSAHTRTFRLVRRN